MGNALVSLSVYNEQVNVGSISAVSRVRSLILPEELSLGMSAGSFSRTVLVIEPIVNG